MSCALYVCYRRLVHHQRILDAAGIDTGDVASGAASAGTGPATGGGSAAAAKQDPSDVPAIGAGSGGGEARGAPTAGVSADVAAVEAIADQFESVHVKDVPTLVLYLGNLNKVTTVADVHEALAQVGVLAARAEVREKHTPTRVSYFAHVYFASPEDTERVSGCTATGPGVGTRPVLMRVWNVPGTQGTARSEHARQQGGGIVPRRRCQRHRLRWVQPGELEAPCQHRQRSSRPGEAPNVAYTCHHTA